MFIPCMRLYYKYPYFEQIDATDTTILMPLACFTAAIFETALYCFLSDTISTTVATLQQYLEHFINFLRAFSFSCFFSPTCSWFEQYEQLSEKAYASNFFAFDIKSMKALMLLMNITNNRPKKIEPVVFVRFEPTLEMLLKVSTWCFFSSNFGTTDMWVLCSISDIEDNIF